MQLLSLSDSRRHTNHLNGSHLMRLIRQGETRGITHYIPRHKIGGPVIRIAHFFRTGIPIEIGYSLLLQAIEETLLRHRKGIEPHKYNLLVGQLKSLLLLGNLTEQLPLVCFTFRSQCRTEIGIEVEQDLP